MTNRQHKWLRRELGSQSQWVLLGSPKSAYGPFATDESQSALLGLALRHLRYIMIINNQPISS